MCFREHVSSLLFPCDNNYDSKNCKAVTMTGSTIELNFADRENPTSFIWKTQGSGSLLQTEYGHTSVMGRLQCGWLDWNVLGNISV
jgi:hypothetical protein